MNRPTATRSEKLFSSSQDSSLTPLSFPTNEQFIQLFVWCGDLAMPMQHLKSDDINPIGTGRWKSQTLTISQLQTAFH